MNKAKSYFIATLLATALAIVPVFGQTSTKVRATTLEPARQAAYIFEVTFDSDVSLSSQIEITFPPAFNLNGAILAASEKLDGRLVIKAQKNSVILSRVDARTPIKAGDSVDFRIASILNPNVMKQDWEFKVAVKDGNRAVEQKVVSTAIEQITKENR